MKNIFAPIKSFISKWFQRREMKKKGFVQSKKKRRLTNEARVLATAAEKSKTLGIIILFIVWCACVAVLFTITQKPMELNLVIGEKTTTTIYSDVDFSYEDKDQTKARKEEARIKEPLVFRFDNKSCNKTIDGTRKVFNAIIMTENNKPLKLGDEYSKSANSFHLLADGLKSALIHILKNPAISKKLMNTLQDSLYHGVFSQSQRDAKFGQKLQIYKREPGEEGIGIIKENIQSASSIPTTSEIAEKIAQEAVTLSSTSSENRGAVKQALTTILSDIIHSSLEYDYRQTGENRDTAEKNTPPVMLDVKKDDLVIQKDKEVDRKMQSRCEAYLKEKIDNESAKELHKRFLNSALLCLLLIVISGIYISHIHPEIVESNQKMGLIAAVVIISVIINYFAIEAFNRSITAFELKPQLIACALPIALSSIILTAMIGLRVAFFSGIFISVIAAMQLHNSFQMVIGGMVICGISAFVGRHRLNYKSYFLASFGTIALITPLMQIINTWSLPNFMELLPFMFIFSFFNALFTTALSLFVIFMLEWLFQVTSDMTLLLLCDYNHPLLKRLQMEAPGTYHHSLMVSTLAEHAAQAISANPIRARVIALFHDIGKMEKPEYFTENQQTEENKHTKLNPNMSSLVILNHTKKGMDLALKYKLRKIIRDGIEQHHGTDTIQYFYQQALEEARQKGQSVDEHDFKYPGPRPREKEVVILSLADPCEAASRSLQKPTPAKIDALVWEIFRKRIRDGELDNANITFGDLKKIRESFVSTLTTMMHGRISYPKDTEEDDEGDLFVATQKKNGNPKKA